MLKTRIEQDLKQALLSGDKPRVEVLRNIKSAILYAEVAAHARETGLPDDQVQAVLAKESKKRAESAELYVRGGAQDRADTELAEKATIDAYLPAPLNDAELTTIVDAVLAELGADAQFGQVIGLVRKQVGTQADGARIAAVVKARLEG